jgi:hypothetical protein
MRVSSLRMQRTRRVLFESEYGWIFVGPVTVDICVLGVSNKGRNVLIGGLVLTCRRCR